MKKKILLFIAVFSILAFTFSGCKKKNDDNVIPPDTLTLDKTSYKQLEVAVINAGSLVLNSSSYTGTVGGTEVIVAHVLDKLAFIVPELPAGAYTLLTNIEGKDYSIALSIEQLPAVTDAQAVINNVLFSAAFNHDQLDSLQLVVQQLNVGADWAQDKTILKNYYDDFNTQYNALSTDDKLQLAKFLKANEAVFAPLPGLRTYIDSTNISYKTQVDPNLEESLNQSVTEITKSEFHLIGLIVSTSALGITCASTRKVWACGASAFSALLLVAKIKHHDMIVTAVLDKVYVISKVWIQEAIRSAKSFNKDQLYALNISIDIRTLYNQDMNNTNAGIKSMVTALNTSSNTRTNANAVIRVPLSGAAPHINTLSAYQSKNFAHSGNYFSIANVSNPVSITSQNMVGDELQVKFTTTATTDQSFTFDVKYNRGQNSITEPISATLVVSNQCPATVTDIDGNVYNTVSIGNQCWMKENLKSTRYENGTAIGEIEDSLTWANIINTSSQTPAWCYYNGTATNNATYGKLYNWYAATDLRNICPIGWHVPSDAEFTQLTDYLGGELVAGGKLKAITLWNAPNTGADNSAGFTALPAGYRVANGFFSNNGNSGDFWSAIESSTTKAWARNFHYNYSGASRYTYYKEHGISVRCVKD